jgi:hypothetical protein
MDSHDQSDLGFGSMELFEEQRKYKKQGDAHKKEEESDKSYNKMPVPHGF